MIYVKDSRKFQTKGEFEIEVKHLKDDSNFRPCFVVFDVLYLNGVCQVKKPFAERLNLLRDLINDKEGVVKKCIPTRVRDVDHVITLINEAIDREEEGVVLKDSLSVYSPGERNAGWCKIKPDYIDGVSFLKSTPEILCLPLNCCFFIQVCSDFDMVIIGGYYRNKSTNSHIKKYIVGVVEKQEDGEYLVHSTAEVATGLTWNERISLNESLQVHFQEISKNEIFSKFSCGRVEWGKKKPDVWIAPDKSLILEVKAAELYKSPDFKTSHSLRFPRINAVRKDKNWNEACTLKEFNSLINNYKGDKGIGNSRKIATRTVNKDDVSPVSKKRGRFAQAKSNFFDEIKDLDEIEPIDNLLEGREYCVWNSKEGLPTKAELERKIHQRGGKSVQVPKALKTFCTFVGKVNPQNRAFIQSGNFNVAKVEWLVNVLSDETIDKRCPKLAPSDMLAMNQELKDVFSESFDEFGMSYFKETTGEELREILMNMDSEKIPDVSEEEEMEFWNEIGPDDFHLFRGRQAIFNGNSDVLKIAENIFKIRGGIVRSEDTNKEVLVISDGQASSINYNWIIDSAQAGEILDMKNYLL